MTNINVNIPDKLHKELKVFAAKAGKSIKEVVIDSLEKYVEGKR